jgi:hypothetical protein
MPSRVAWAVNADGPAATSSTKRPRRASRSSGKNRAYSADDRPKNATEDNSNVEETGEVKREFMDKELTELRVRARFFGHEKTRLD